jgi:hypothetical protein
MPPRPWKYSGRRAEWEAIYWSDAGYIAQGFRPPVRSSIPTQDAR